MEQDISLEFFSLGGKGNYSSIRNHFNNKNDELIYQKQKLTIHFRTQLDIDSKKWRVRADILNDIAMAVEILVLPKYLEHSTFILCATTSIKAIVGVAGDSQNIDDEHSILMVEQCSCFSMYSAKDVKMIFDFQVVQQDPH